MNSSKDITEISVNSKIDDFIIIKKDKKEKKKRRKKNYLKNIFFILFIGFLFLLIYIMGYKTGFHRKIKENQNEEKANKNKQSHSKDDTNITSLNVREDFFSYSQKYEDLILYDVLKDTINGFYIDVGAYDPIYDSVTQAFYERGWNGINIEPLPHKFIRYIELRPRDYNLHKCAGDREGNITFYSKGGLSTTQLIEAKKWKKTNLAKITSVVNVTKLETVCRKYVHKNKTIDFLKIDVETYEKEVILGFNFTEYRPRVICIESTEPCSMRPLHSQWEYILIENDYEFAYNYSVNRFYIDKRKKELKGKFIGIPNLLKKYNVTKVISKDILK